MGLLVVDFNDHNHADHDKLVFKSCVKDGDAMCHVTMILAMPPWIWKTRKMTCYLILIAATSGYTKMPSTHAHSFDN